MEGRNNTYPVHVESSTIKKVELICIIGGELGSNSRKHRYNS